MKSHESSQTEQLPEGLHNAYWFQAFNCFSFSLIVGTPILLFFKKLDASVTVLGIVAALPPLLNIMQIPAARHVETVGYRLFVLRGWVVRSVFVLLAAGVAMLPEQIDTVTRMALMLFLIFCYNLSRGISVCGFLPWITQLVPEAHRSRYLSRDQIFGFTSICLSSLLCGVYLKYDDSLFAFGMIFLGSFLAAVVSLYFLKRIPDVPVPEELKSKSKEPVPWKRMLTYTPFARCLIYNVVMLLGWTGNGVLIVPLLKDEFQLSDAWFMVLNASWGVVFVLVLIFMGKVSDWAGSKPVLGLSFVFQIAHFAGWGLVAAHVLPFNLPVIALQQVTWGVAFALFNVANMRLLMGIVPELGRSHFFALFSVGTSLTAGLAPIGWGMLADILQGQVTELGGVRVTGFAWLYVGIVVLVVIAFACLARVEEEHALTRKQFFKELVVRSPARTIPRVLTKRLWP